MSVPRRLVTAVAVVAAVPALAAPRVTVDIAPVHSIVAAVMAGVGAPELIVPPGVTEHRYALRPSEAAALEAAELVVWVGPGLTPWLGEPIGALASEARVLELEETPGLRLREMREGGPFEAHAEHAAHAEGAAHVEGEAQAEDEDEHAHEHEHEHEHEHDHGAIDPHIWLDPANAAIIAVAAAEALGAIDAANASVYAANAEAFAERMAGLTAEISRMVEPVRGRGYVVFHDAYQYFEAAFEVPAAGSISLGDAEAPGAARVAEIRERLAGEGIACVFAEPQFEPKLVATLIEGTDARTGTLDPLGAGLDQGAGLYPALLTGLAADLVACLSARS